MVFALAFSVPLAPARALLGMPRPQDVLGCQAARVPRGLARRASGSALSLAFEPPNFRWIEREADRDRGGVTPWRARCQNTESCRWRAVVSALDGAEQSFADRQQRGKQSLVLADRAVQRA